MNYFNRVVRAVIAIVISLIALFSGISYVGSKSYYFLFTVSFVCLLLYVFRKSYSYTAKFISGLLFLGFWLKISIHNIFLYDYYEPVGSFKFSGAEFDQVLMIASIGSFTVLATVWVLDRFFKRNTDFSNKNTFVPNWYRQNSKLVWTFFILGVIAVSALNFIFGIQQSGLTPNTVLIWPLNSVVYMCLATYFSSGICLLLNWELALNKNISKKIYLVILEGYLSGASILSRATYLFHIFPFVFLLLFNNKVKKMLSIWNRIIFLVSVVVAFGLTIATVTLSRNIYFYNLSYSAPPEAPAVEVAGAPKLKVVSRDENIKNLPDQIIYTLKGLVIDRWVGAEGLMSVISYEQKGFDAYQTALFESPAMSRDALFNKISNSVYMYASDKYQFSTIPGPMALFYLSGNVFVFIISIAMVLAIFLLFEMALNVLFKNFILTTVFSMHLATIFVQIGVAPKVLVKHLILNIIFFAGMFFLTSWDYVKKTKFTRTVNVEN